MTRFGTQSNDDFECIVYDSNNTEHILLLENYMKSCGVKNNSSPEELRLEFYDGINGILFMLLNIQTMTIDGMSSCIKVDDSAKVFHRLHLKPNVPHSAIDRFIEYETYDWCWKNNIKKLWFVVNEGHDSTLHWVSKRVGERRNANRPNKYKSDKYNFIRAGWQPYDKLIYERNTWQYCIYYSEDGSLPIKREEKELDQKAYDMFKKEYPNATQNWE